MKKVIKFNACYAGKKNYILIGFSVLLLFCAMNVTAHDPSRIAYTANKDGDLTREIKKQLRTEKKNFRFPHSVTALYEQNNFMPAWITGESNPKRTWDSMLLLDCVLQYGLSPADYHPDVLLYDKLQTMVNEPRKITNHDKARFDLFLTDALITLVNHLHYGKLNPEFPPFKIDRTKSGFRAERILTDALHQADFTNAILAVQPKSKEYAAMQDRMRLLKGQYLDDCYEIPEEDVRKIAINMERIRWAAINENTYIQINIPTYTLKVYQDGAISEFKVIVGRPGHPTPMLNSLIAYLSTNDKVKTPYTTRVDIEQPLRGTENLNKNDIIPAGNSGTSVVFHFGNNRGIVMKGNKDKRIFERANRALSDGDIIVDNAGKLAVMLLKMAGAGNKVKIFTRYVKNGNQQRFKLPRAIPIKVTYLTAEVKEGETFNYKDIYNLDKRFEMKLYHSTQNGTVK